MKKIVILLLVIVNLFLCNAQELECGTEISDRIVQLSLKDSDSHYYRNIRSTSFSENDTIYFPIQFHIIRQSSGIGGLSADSIPIVINILNYYYSECKIKFYRCNDVHYIDDSSLFSYYNYKTQRPTLESLYNNQDNINIYFFPYITNGYSLIAGVSTFPDDTVMSIAIDNNYATTSTLPHEMGHFFNVYHTHETAFGHELVRRTNGNCTTAGDKCCDTPADPNLNKDGMVNASCVYIGDTTDIYGDLYEPDPTNLMCYCRYKNCRNHFSLMQYERIRDAAFHPNRFFLAHQQVFENIAWNNNDTTIKEGSVRMRNIQLNNSVLRINYCNEVIIENSFTMDNQSSLDITNQ